MKRVTFKLLSYYQCWSYWIGIRSKMFRYNGNLIQKYCQINFEILCPSTPFLLGRRILGVGSWRSALSVPEYRLELMIVLNCLQLSGDSICYYGDFWCRQICQNSTMYSSILKCHIKEITYREVTRSKGEGHIFITWNKDSKNTLPKKKGA